MTVSTTDSEVVHVSGGPAFPIPYRFLQNADIEAVLVKQDGTSETLTGAQYTLTGAGSQSGGTLTSSYAAGVLATPGASLTISRDMDAVQPTDLRNQGKYLAETHENVFDRLTMLIQQGLASVRRALKKPIGKDYYDAQGAVISNLGNPTKPQDAATYSWVSQFVGSIISAIQGPINNAANIFFLGPTGNSNVVQDLSDTSDPYKGSALVGRQPLQINTVAELRQTAGRFDGDVAVVKNYLVGDGKGSHIKADWIVVTLPAVPPADDGGMIIRVAGVSNAYWKRRLNEFGEVDAEVYGLPLGAGQDCYNKAKAVVDYSKANKVGHFFGPGPRDKGMFVSVPIYDTFEQSFPLSGPRNPGLPLEYMGFTTRSTPDVTFQTSSTEGADVFNVCCLSDWSLLGFPKIKGTLGTLTGSGSNGVSMVFGARNIVIEADPTDMPMIWIPGGGTDGGHGFTIQTGAGNINEYVNVVFRGHVRNCTTALNVDCEMTNSILRPDFNIVMDNVIGEDCYRGLTFGLTAPTASIVDPRAAQPCAAVSGRITLINCQQPLVEVRSFGGNREVEILNTKEKADLVKNPNSTSVTVATVQGAKHGSLKVNARVLSVDKVLSIGAISMGGNAYPSVEHFDFEMRVRYKSAVAEFDQADTSSPPLRSSTVKLHGFVSVPSSFAAKSLRSTVIIDGREMRPTIYAGDANAEPSAGATVVFDAPLTAVRTVFTPPAILSVTGDQITVIRTSAASGGGVTFAGVSVAAGTRANFIYNGTAWVSYP